MTQIDYFFSVLSPFTYLAGDQLERMAQRHEAKVNYKPIDIMGLFGRTGGVAPKDRHESRKAYRLQDLRRIADLAEMDINLAPAHWPTNPAPASAAIITIGECGAGDVGALTRNLLRACWAEDKDIALPEVISECLAESGCKSGKISPDDFGLRQFAANTDEAVSRNVFGSPTYVINDQVFWGQDRLLHLEAWLDGRLS